MLLDMQVKPWADAAGADEADNAQAPPSGEDNAGLLAALAAPYKTNPAPVCVPFNIHMKTGILYVWHTVPHWQVLRLKGGEIDTHALLW